jgi:hypothetical protein
MSMIAETVAPSTTVIIASLSCFFLDREVSPLTLGEEGGEVSALGAVEPGCRVVLSPRKLADKTFMGRGELFAADRRQLRLVLL